MFLLNISLKKKKSQTVAEWVIDENWLFVETISVVRLFNKDRNVSIFHFLPSWIIVTQNISVNFCACLASKQLPCFKKKQNKTKDPQMQLSDFDPNTRFLCGSLFFPSTSQNCSVVITLGKMGFRDTAAIYFKNNIFPPPLAAGKSVCRQSLHSVIFARAPAEAANPPLPSLPQSIGVGISR